MPRNDVSMISLVMRHLKMEPAEQVALADLTFNGADFSDIFGDIFGDLFGGGGARRGGRASNGPMKGANVRKSVRITFEEAVFGCEKELDVVSEGSVYRPVNGTGAKPGTSPETCPKCGGKGQVVYTQQSFFGTVQNVQTCPNCARQR